MSQASFPPYSHSATEERFKALLSATSDVVYCVSPDWTLMHPLDGRGFLLDAAEPTAQWKEKNVYFEDLTIVEKAISEAIKTKSIFQLEHRVNRVDGSIGWTFSRALPIFDSKGDIIEWFGLASDITERKLAEKSLSESKEILEQQKRIYETITSGTPDLMYVFDLEYRFTYANKALLEMWGKSWEEAIGKGLLENGYEPWHADMHKREIDEIRKTAISIRGEVAFPHAILGRRLYDYILNPVFDESGKVIAVSGTTRDVTDRHLWEEQLKESAEKLRAMNEEFAAVNRELVASNEQILEVNEHLSQANLELNAAKQKIEEGRLALRQAIEAANFGTWYLHSNTREFTTDARVKELFGYSADESLSIDQAIAQIKDEYRDLVSDKLEDAIRQNIDYDVTYPVIGFHDKKLRWLRSVGHLMADQSENFSAFTGLIIDVTDQKMEEIRKNDFMAMVSHELKTPLTSLSAYLQLLEVKQKSNPDQVSLRVIAQSMKQTKRMTDMINGFLDFSRLESASMSIRCSDFDVVDLIQDAKEEVHILYSLHTFIFEPVENQIINGDKGKLGQVVTNLIGNAVKYSKPGTVVHISCISANQLVKVSVRDQGNGIDNTDLPKIFDRFYRVKSDEPISGFGIGLYVCKEIIKLHGGEIWAESTLGRGSVFSFTLPVQ